MTEISRWNDDRLDDLAREVRDQAERIGHIENIRGEIIELRSEVRIAGKEATECTKTVHKLGENIEKRADAQHKERKADRRWMIGTVLATASLVVAALAIFLG